MGVWNIRGIKIVKIASVDGECWKFCGESSDIVNRSYPDKFKERSSLDTYTASESYWPLATSVAKITLAAHEPNISLATYKTNISSATGVA